MPRRRAIPPRAGPQRCCRCGSARARGRPIPAANSPRACERRKQQLVIVPAARHAFQRERLVGAGRHRRGPRDLFDPHLAPTPDCSRMCPRSASRPSDTSIALFARPRNRPPRSTRGSGASSRSMHRGRNGSASSIRPDRCASAAASRCPGNQTSSPVWAPSRRKGQVGRHFADQRHRDRKRPRVVSPPITRRRSALRVRRSRRRRHRARIRRHGAVPATTAPSAGRRPSRPGRRG